MATTLLEEKSLRWLVESATDAMLIADIRGRIILANPPIERMFGYGREELIGQPVELLIPQRFRDAHVARRIAFTAAPTARAMGAGLELYGARRDGTEFPVDVSLSPLSADGEQLVLATIHDISRRKQAERDLAAQTVLVRESETRMRAIFETAVEGIIVIDEKGSIERFNPGAERMFGYKEAEVLGHNISMLMPSPDRERHDGYLAAYLATGERHVIGIGREVEGLCKNGTTILLELSVGEMRIGGRRMFTGTVRDISQRKAAETRQAQLLQELESANDELKNFAYVVSHDLKAPLRAIGSLAAWIASDYADQFDAEGKENLNLLVGRVRRMDRLIDGILQYSRVGRIKEALVAVNLESLLPEIIDSLQPPPHIQIQVDFPLPVLRLEPTRVQQVFQNLISNSIKYMDKPTGKIHVRAEPDGAYWHFSVSDNGPGIEPRHFDRIFQLFQTLAPRDRIESTGVGLALVKKIVEMYGGRVWVESRMGEGSTFHFTLPSDEADNDPREESLSED